MTHSDPRILDGDVVAARLDDWRVYEGVRTRRVLAFCIDYLTVALLTIPFFVLVFLFGLITLGLGWALYGVLFPTVALFYVAASLGGRRQATWGMQLMSIRLARLDGKVVDPVLAVVHTVLFWAGNVILTPFILLATLVLDRKRTVHDLLLGTVVTRSDR
jgi:uncharacterized RDD family membrane protein YckC